MKTTVAIANRRSIRRIGGILLTALTLCLAGRPARRAVPAPPRRARRSKAVLFAIRGCFGGRSSRAAHSRCRQPIAGRLRKSFCPAARSGFRQSLQRHALCRSRQCVRLSRQGQRQLLLQRQGRARPRPRRVLRRSDIAAGRHRRHQRRPCDLHTAGTGPQNSRRSTRRRANGRAAFPRSRCGRRRRARRSSRWPMTTQARPQEPRSRGKAIQPSNCATTSSASDSDEVRPGDSIPNRCVRPGSPCCAGPSIMKSAAGSPGSGQLRADAGIVGLQ